MPVATVLCCWVDFGFSCSFIFIIESQLLITVTIIWEHSGHQDYFTLRFSWLNNLESKSYKKENGDLQILQVKG